MVLSSTWRNPAKFARMASVEELDSSLTLLTHHSTKGGKNSIKTNEIDSLSPSAESKTKTRIVLSPVNSVLSAASILTPPGTPYSGRTISPETTISQTFDYVSPNLSATNSEPKEWVSANINVKSRTVVGSTTSGPNVVAIDNKIEQAMDLVKTHLTFAVREEVEILRSAIVELESKVSQLESQNQLLRQFAPTEVLANLNYYIQKKKEAQQVAITPAVSVPSVAFQPMPVSVQPVSSASTQALVIQPQTVPSNVAAVAPTIATQHAAISTQTIAMQQQQSMQQSMSASTPSLTTQHAASLLQSSLNQQVGALSQIQQPTIIQATMQQQTLTAQKTTLIPQSSTSTQIPQMIQQTVATKHLSNVAVATVPIGSDVLLQQQPQSTVVTNATAQLHYADPNDPKPTVM